MSRVDLVRDRVREIELPRMDDVAPEQTPLTWMCTVRPSYQPGEHRLEGRHAFRVGLLDPCAGTSCWSRPRTCRSHRNADVEGGSLDRLARGGVTPVSLSVSGTPALPSVTLRRTLFAPGRKNGPSVCSGARARGTLLPEATADGPGAARLIDGLGAEGGSDARSPSLSSEPRRVTRCWSTRRTVVTQAEKD